MTTRSARVGVVILLALFTGSLLLGALFPSVLHDHCLLGRDLVRPDRTVCELAFGGLWVSLAVALLAAGLSTVIGLVLAVALWRMGGVVERLLLRAADAFFSLPDVLVLMVLQLAGQTLGDLRPSLKLSSFALMVVSLAALGWAAPTRILHNRLTTLARAEHVAAARALGASPNHVFARHLWPFLRGVVGTVFLARIPASVLAESTVSFLGIARLEPMSLGRYLGTSYATLLYPGGMRIVGPSWALLLLVVLGASLAARRGGEVGR